jgi:lysine 6-dehydrogenase
MKIIVLGGGLVGGPMAMDLAAENIYEVTVADRDEKVLEDLVSRADITPVTADLGTPRRSPPWWPTMISPPAPSLCL